MNTPSNSPLSRAIKVALGLALTAQPILTFADTGTEPQDKTTLAYSTTDIVPVGAVFDPFMGVTVQDGQGNDITAQTRVLGGVDTYRPGRYEIFYQPGTDGEAHVRIVTVLEPDHTEISADGTAVQNAIIKGADSRIVQLGEDFDPMAGIDDRYEQGDQSSYLYIDGYVDTYNPSVYTLTYLESDDSGNSTEAVRNIVVRDPNAPSPNPPEINLPESDTIQINGRGNFDPMAGVTASDPEDGDLTRHITVNGYLDPGNSEPQSLLYMVTDNDGYATSRLREVTVVVNEPPVIYGVLPVDISVGDDFDPAAGVTAQDPEDGDLTSRISYRGIVNTKSPGRYQLFYQVEDSQGEKASSYRLVTVKARNTPPELRGVGALAINQGDAFNPRSGISASDREEGDLTYKLQVTGHVNTQQPGSYTLLYTVTDRQGETTTAKRVVTVQGNNGSTNGSRGDSSSENSVPIGTNRPPVISGVGPVTVPVGGFFNPRTGVTASDPEDGDITYRIHVAGYFSPYRVGTYTLIYTVTDFNGQTTSVQRSVTIANRSSRGR